MITIQQISQDRVQARTSGDTLAYNLLTTLLGDLELEAKRAGSVDVLKVIRNYINNSEITLKAKPDHTQTQNELFILKCYMPKQLDADELNFILQAGGFDSMGAFMSHLKSAFPNQYDGKLASQLYKDWAGG